MIDMTGRNILASTALLIAVLFAVFALSASFKQSATQNNENRPALSGTCENNTGSGSGCLSTSSPETPPLSIQSGRIDEHLTIDNALHSVNVCGKPLKAKQVYIDGVDIVQRIAQLSTDNPSHPQGRWAALWQDMCWNIISATPPGISGEEPRDTNGIIPIPDVTNYTNDAGHPTYQIIMGQAAFQIDAVTGDIYYLDGIGDPPEGPIGNLRK